MRNKRSTMIWLLLVGILILTLALVGVAFAQDNQPSDDQVNAIAKGLYCPVCENVPLDVCPTQACTQWRQLIREMLAEGRSEAEIKDYFVLQYGDRVLAEPPRRGLNWLVYILPPVAILAGAFVLYRAMRSWQAPTPEGPATPTSEGMPPDEYVTRLEQELEKRDRT